MKRFTIRIILAILGSCLSGSGILTAQDREAPPNVAAALLIKLAAFEKNISESENVTIHVFGESDITAELEKAIGQPVGNATLANVSSSHTFPEEKPSILFIADEDKLDMGIEYTQQNKVLSVAGKTALVQKGVTLGFGIGSNGKPSIKLNLSSTVLEDVSWNPVIMKLAKTVK